MVGENPLLLFDVFNSESGEEESSPKNNPTALESTKNFMEKTWFRYVSRKLFRSSPLSLIPKLLFFEGSNGMNAA